MDPFNIEDLDLLISSEFSKIPKEDMDTCILLNSVAEKVLKSIEGLYEGIYVIIDESCELVPTSNKGDVSALEFKRDDTISKDILMRIIEEGRSWIEDFGNIIYLPIKNFGRTIGFIRARRDSLKNPFSKSDIELLEAMSQKLSPIFDNIRLLREKEKSLSQISELMEISSILNSSLEPRVVRKKAVEAITRLLDCEVGSLLLLDEEAQELYFEVALGEKGDKVKKIRLKVGEGIAGWVAKNNEAVLIDDVKEDPRHFFGADEKSSFETRSMVCAPMVLQKKVIGVLQAINKLEQRKFTAEDLELLKSLSHQVAIAVDNARLHEELRETFYQTAEALVDATEKKDPYTGDHTKRVMKYSMAIARYLDFTDAEMENLRLASILHDVGKIGIEDSVLRKASELDQSEFEKIKVHPELGEEILGHIKMLKKVLPGMRHHHERIDGKGYPDGLKMEEIPIIARIIAVADTFDAMTTNRPYRKALKDDEAALELKHHAGTQFDPIVVEAFNKAYSKGEIKRQDK